MRSIMSHIYRGLYFLWTFMALSVTANKVYQEVNNRPIIGLVVKPNNNAQNIKHGDEYVEATYVKYLESAGARVVPIRGKQSLAYYEHIFNNINGVLFPGGKQDLSNSTYADVGKFIYRKAIKANNGGDYFPLWGTCLGFELLTVLTVGKDLLKDTDTENMTLPLHFVKDFESSRLFQDIPPYLVTYLRTEPLTQNNHKYSLLIEDFKKTASLTDFYQVLSTSIGRDDKEFVSALEAKHYPFYGVQFHPEKSIFKWTSNTAINHGTHSILASQYFADFFVNEARKSRHHFDSESLAAQVLIENDLDIFVPDNTFKETYYFNYTNNHPLLFKPENNPLRPKKGHNILPRI